MDATRSFALSFAILVTGLTVGACQRGEPVVAEMPAEASEPTPVNVAAWQVQTSTLTERVELTGRLEPWLEVRVSSELGGLVEQIGFDKGAFVREGQILARVGTDLHEAGLAEAEAILEGAEATYKRAEALVERQAVPRQNAINAKTEYEAALARVTQSRLRVERSIVRAPLSGTAVTREIEMGEVLAPGTLITTIHQANRLKATVGIPENDVTLFHVGSEATLEFDAWPDRTFDGRIAFIAPSTTGSTRTFPAEIGIDNRDGSLRPGMIARVALVRRVHEDAVVVPRDALQERDLGSVAVVLDDDLARVRPVTLGGTDGDRVLVEDGLEPGDWLVVSGQRGLIDGQRVHVVERREQ